MDSPTLPSNLASRNLLADDPTGDGPPSDDIPSDPKFTFNTTGRCGGNLRNGFATFRTQVKLTGDADHASRNGPSLQDYPYDK